MDEVAFVLGVMMQDSVINMMVLLQRLWSSSTCISWETVRNASFRAPPSPLGEPSILCLDEAPNL